MDIKARRKIVADHFNNREAVKDLLEGMGIDVMRSYHFKLRDEKTPSAFINTNGSIKDFGSGESYSDVVALLFDGYSAFSSVVDALSWCESKI